MWNKMACGLYISTILIISLSFKIKRYIWWTWIWIDIVLKNWHVYCIKQTAVEVKKCLLQNMTFFIKETIKSQSYVCNVFWYPLMMTNSCSICYVILEVLFSCQYRLISSHSVTKAVCINSFEKKMHKSHTVCDKLDKMALISVVFVIWSL